MARVARTIKRRQFRLSLDPMDPVEGEALRRIDLMVKDAREIFGDEITQEEAERFAFKRLLLDILSNRPAEMATALRVEAVKATPLPLTPAEVPSPTRAAVAPVNSVNEVKTEPVATPVAAINNTPIGWAEALVNAPPPVKASPLLQGLTWKENEDS